MLVAFLSLLALPGISYAAGMRPINNENRPLVMPSPIDLSAVQDPAWFATLDAHLADHFPPKNQLVWANAALRYFVLRDAANPDVVLGREQWLFGRDEVDPLCTFGAGEVVSQLGSVAAGLAPSGVDLYVVIAPDKQAIYPEFSPDGFEACTNQERARMVHAMSSAPERFIELWSVLHRARAADPGTLMYWPQDTHWSPIGGMTAFRAVIDRIDPAVWNAPSIHRRGTVARVGDLSRLLGLSLTDELPAIAIDPPPTVERSLVETPVTTTPGREPHHYAVEGGRLIDGHTLIVHDSAFGVYGGLLAPWFEESTWLHINELLAHPELLDDIDDFDRVIVERVERYAYAVDYEALLTEVVARASRSAR